MVDLLLARLTIKDSDPKICRVRLEAQVSVVVLRKCTIHTVTIREWELGELVEELEE